MGWERAKLKGSPGDLRPIRNPASHTSEWRRAETQHQPCCEPRSRQQVPSRVCLIAINDIVENAEDDNINARAEKRGRNDRHNSMNGSITCPTKPKKDRLVLKGHRREPSTCALRAQLCPESLQHGANSIFPEAGTCKKR